MLQYSTHCVEPYSHFFPAHACTCIIIYLKEFIDSDWLAAMFQIYGHVKRVT